MRWFSDSGLMRLKGSTTMQMCKSVVANPVPLTERNNVATCWRQTKHDLSRDTTKPTMWQCAQRRLRSAWASAQSRSESLLSAWRKLVFLALHWAHSVWSESLLSAWRKLGFLATHWAHSEDSDQTGRMHINPVLQVDLSLRYAHSNFVGFVMSRLICIRTGSCTV